MWGRSATGHDFLQLGLSLEKKEGEGNLEIALEGLPGSGYSKMLQTSISMQVSTT